MPGDEGEPDDDVEPLLHHLTVGAGQPDQQIGQEPALHHLPHPFDPQVHRPPAVVDAHRVVVVGDERGEVEEGGERESGDQHSFRRGEPPRLPDGHADVVEEHQHYYHDGELDRKRLLQQLVPLRPSEEVSHHADHTRGVQIRAASTPAAAVKLGARFLRHHPVGGAHEAGEHPHEQQVGVDLLADVEGEQAHERIRPEVLRDRQDPEHHLKP